MINALWIIKKQEGVCIFHKKYRGWEIDSDLFSGFLSGIYSFSEEISETGGIEIMELRDMRLLYGVASDLIYILAITKDEDPDLLRTKLSEISKIFFEKYGIYLTNWKGDISAFENFQRDLDLFVDKLRNVDFIEVPQKIHHTKRLKLSQDEFEVLKFCDGQTSYLKIADKLQISELNLIKIIKGLEKKKLIQRKRIIRS